MNFLIRYTIFTFILTTLTFQAFAQNDWESDGEIKDVEIEIVKNREIKLPSVNRNFEKIPPLSSLGQKEEMTYFYNTLNFNLEPLDIKIRPLRIKEEKLDKFYGNYIKGGFGNYVTPYFEGYVNSKRNNKYSYGAHLNYLNSRNGPVDEENSGSGVLDVDVFGKSFGENSTLSGAMAFTRNNYHFYGYNEGLEVSADSIEQVFNRFSIDLGLQNAKAESDFDYDLGLIFNHVSDLFEATENQITVKAMGGYSLSYAVTTGIKSEFSSIKQEDAQFSTNRTLLKVNPYVRFEYQDFLITAGFNIAYEDDTLGSSDDLHFFPLAEAKYPFSSVLELYAGITGDVEKQTLNSITNQNPYIGANQPVYHNIKTFDFYGGARGKLNNDIGYHAGFSIANYKNFHYFLNSQIDQSRFFTAFDTENTAVANVFGELTLSKNKLRSTFRADYFGYDASDNIGSEAWHRPNYQLTLTTSYNLFDKVLLNSSFYGIGGIKALDATTNEEINLDAAFDLCLKADYLVSKRVSVFASFNNIFSQEYELLYRYPVRKLQILAGLTYSF